MTLTLIMTKFTYSTEIYVKKDPSFPQCLFFFTPGFSILLKIIKFSLSLSYLYHLANCTSEFFNSNLEFQS
jgi:hypothetical protein